MTVEERDPTVDTDRGPGHDRASDNAAGISPRCSPDAEAAEDAMHGGASARLTLFSARAAGSVPAPGSRPRCAWPVPGRPSEPAPVWTESDAFAWIMDDLTFNGIAPEASPEH